VNVQINPKQSSYSGDGIVTTDYARDGVIRGVGFGFERNFAIANGATLNILIDYTTFIPTSSMMGQIVVMPPFFQTSVGPVTVNIYRNTKYSGGTPFECINLNTLSKKRTSATTFTTGPTGSVKGDVVLEYLVGGVSQGNQSASGTAGGIAFFLRPNKSKTLIEVVNGAAADIVFHFAQVIYEI